MATISGSRAAPVSDALMAIDVGTSHPYTCNTCQVAFRNSDLQKAHMRGDWHRYNLKRRVASLPPISSEMFTEKVLQARVASTVQADKAGFEKSCDACQKTYYSENSYRNHIGSSKHKARLAAVLARSNGKVDDEASSMMSSTFSLGDPAEAKSVVDSDAEEEFNEVVEGLKKTALTEGVSPLSRPSNPPLSAAEQRKEEHPVSLSSSEDHSASMTPSTATPVPSAKPGPAPTLKTCLFCNYESPTAPLNVIHMERIHGMFVPEKEYLVNPEGLLAALQTRVFELHECISCGKPRKDAFAAQTHMRDKGHCQIPYTTEAEQLEIGEFYDFRSTYSDDEDDSDNESTDGGEAKPKSGAKLGAKRPSKVTGEDGEEREDDGWETDSSASSLDSDDLHAVPAEHHYHQYERLDKHPHHSRNDQRAHHRNDGWHAHNHRRALAVFYDEFELHLPSGKSVGHRSLNKYYRQNLHSHPSPQERAERAERLVLEEAESSRNRMDVGSDEEQAQQLSRRDNAAHGRTVINRDYLGLGVRGNIADPNLGEVKKVVMRGRKQEFGGRQAVHTSGSKIYFKQVHRNPVSYLR
ncbi:C2H2 type zinc-finger-domain-containing protein [Lasiosphaeris hirsuta]|uniref:C2H2 type zinc-finger-domain-containing protein n=1 Tax=Lasiosphaeris hirsuta TaxID=260670 RepID=A0AA40DNZ2_9PEZI|nr:C2H2 type zinc-finger-domain-containing protein [Lasiosphaeris hirsuta]